MSAQLIAFFIDKIIASATAVIVTLIGYRKIGPRLGSSERYDSLYVKWLKHLKWIGPLSLIIVVLQTLFVYHESVSVTKDAEKSKQEQIGKIISNVTAKGELAEADTPIVSAAGFTIVALAGYTYSKPESGPFELVAIKDINGRATPAYSVFEARATHNVESFIEDLKAEMIKKNETTKFSDTQVIDKEKYKLYRVFLTTQRQDGLLKAGMAFIEARGKFFMLNYGTLESEFAANEADFEKIVQSFSPYFIDRGQPELLKQQRERGQF